MKAGHDPLKAVGMLLLATVCWGFSFPLMKALLLAQRALVPAGTDWFFAAYTQVVRFGLAAVVMAWICRRTLRGLNRQEIKLGVGLGLCGGAGTLLQMAGLGQTLASTSAFLTQFYVLLIPVVLAVWYRRWPGWQVMGSCGLVFAGMGQLCGVDWRAFRLGVGEWLTLAASVIFMGQILWLDRREFGPADKARATWVMFAVMSGMFVPMALATAPTPGAWVTASASGTVAGMLVVLVLVCAVTAFYLMNEWQPRIQPTHAGVVYCAEPVFASLYSLVLPGWLAGWGGFEYRNEVVTANLWSGGALITLANVLIQFAPRPARTGLPKSGEGC
jgi:drug/metabolite transporter (DMT)-like permease